MASGDFSVYLPPKHPMDKTTHLDVLFMDFNKMVEELGSIETLKTDFFSNVSHEIKTPLAVIQNNAELLQKKQLTEEQRQEYAATILQSTKRLSNLITNMLKLNKLEKQVIKPLPQMYDVCNQLCTCALQFEDTWEKKQIDFEAEIEDHAMICADEGLLEIVWNNLLSNALKFTPEGGCVKVSQTSSADGVTVVISDTGCGMDAKTMKKIFDKFYQGDTSMPPRETDLGLLWFGGFWSCPTEQLLLPVRQEGEYFHGKHSQISFQGGAAGMSLEPEKTYIGYEYKEIAVPNKDVSLFLDCYENFGWTAEEPRPIQSGKGTVTLHLKRTERSSTKWN